MPVSCHFRGCKAPLSSIVIGGLPLRACFQELATPHPNGAGHHRFKIFGTRTYVHTVWPIAIKFAWQHAWWGVCFWESNHVPKNKERTSQSPDFWEPLPTLIQFYLDLPNSVWQHVSTYLLTYLLTYGDGHVSTTRVILSQGSEAPTPPNLEPTFTKQPNFANWMRGKLYRVAPSPGKICCYTNADARSVCSSRSYCYHCG